MAAATWRRRAGRVRRALLGVRRTAPGPVVAPEHPAHPVAAVREPAATPGRTVQPPPVVAPSPLPPRDGPELSVVIPVCDVEAYVAECLRSVLSQGVDGLEVVVVDDGSTDSTPEIVSRLAVQDPRIVVLHQENTGNGAARNRAIARATGRYLTFADGDDIVPPGSYAAMLATLRETGSDFVCGSFLRLEDGRRRSTALAARANSRTVLRTDAASSPQVMHNPFFWNKMFVRSFWDSAVGRIPEGVNYEDQEPTTLAYLRARSFDLIDRDVYVWRRREDGSSLTQRKHEIDDLRDRCTVIRRLAALMTAEASAEVRAQWVAKVAGDDLKHFIAQTPVTGEEYFAELVRAVRGLDAEFRNPLDTVPFVDRALWACTARGRRADVETILGHTALHGSSHPIVGGRVVPAFDVGGLPDDVTRVRPVDLTVEGRLHELTWVAPAVLRVVFSALVRGVDPRELREVRLVAVNSVTGESLVRATAAQPDATLDREVNDSWQSYTRSVRSALVPVEDLRARAGGGEWTFHATALAPGGPVIVPLTTLRAGASFPASAVVDGHRGVFRWDGTVGPTLRHEAVTVTATSLAVDGRRVRLDVVGADGQEIVALVLAARGHPDRVVPAKDTRPDGATFVFHHPYLGRSVPLTRTVVWGVKARTRTGSLVGVAVPVTSHEMRHGPGRHADLRFGSSGWGYLTLEERRWRCGLDTVTLDDAGTTLTLAGTARSIEARTPDLLLVAPGATLTPTRVRRVTASGRWEATYDLRDATTGAAAASGRYVLRWRASWHRNATDAYYVEDLRDLGPGSDSTEHLTPLHRVVAQRTRTRGFALHLRTPFAADERGRHAQRTLQSRYFAAGTSTGTSTDGSGGTARRVRPGVLLESFNGKSFGDNVSPVAQELAARGLDVPMYVGVQDRTVPVPDFLTPVVAHTREWYEAASTASVLVTNNNLPHYFRKRDDQHYVQLWHGTPLKRLLLDMPPQSRQLSYWQLMDRERHDWDVLIAQNAASVAPFQSAFGFEGRIDVLGYPRNDALVVGAADRRAEVRARLGLEDDQPTVLYMPTWRDTARGADGRVAPVSYLDVDRFVRGAGRQWRVLTRSHHVVGARLASDNAAVIDVSAWPEVSDLYLAADVLVTDYSSAMFDYTVTGKPIVFLTPDLDRYAGQTRGFYLDLPALAPGPLLTSTDELVDHVAWVEQDAAGHAERYAAWRDRFNRWDDGRAAARVADLVETRLGG